MNYTVSSLFRLKKDKPGFRRIMKSLSSSVNQSDITLAKNISSIITHILIEMENSETKEEAIRKGEGYRLYNWIDLQISLINGKRGVEDTIKIIQAFLEE